MNTERRATICILTYGEHLAYFRRCLDTVLATTPRDAIELRLGFNQAPTSFYYALGTLCPAGGVPERTVLPGSIERLTWTDPGGLTVRLWRSPVNLYKEPMCRLLYHDVPLMTEYAIWFDDDSYVEDGWWQELSPLLEKRVDYIGQVKGVIYLPGQPDMIQAQPWYRGVPYVTVQGRPGVNFVTGGFLAIRAQRLREVNFPDTYLIWKGRTLQQYGGDTLLGEIARQLSWTWAHHDKHILVNVDLQGRHPAPRRGGIGRQFGSDIDVVVV